MLIMILALKRPLTGAKIGIKWSKFIKNLIFQLTDKDDSHDKNVIRPDFKNLKQVWEFYQFWHAF